MEKCLVVRFEKEAKCYIQENLMTTKSLNYRKKKIVDGIDTKPQTSLVLWNTYIFCKKKFIVLYKFQVKIFRSVEQKVGNHRKGSSSGYNIE